MTKMTDAEALADRLLRRVVRGLREIETGRVIEVERHEICPTPTFQNVYIVPADDYAHLTTRLAAADWLAEAAANATHSTPSSIDEVTATCELIGALAAYQEK